MPQKILPIINVEKLYVAKLKTETDDNATYDVPKYLEGIKEIGIKPKQDSSPYFHEGKKVLEELSLSDVDVTINITDLTDEEEAYCLGHKLANEGGVIRNSNDIPPELAFIIKANKAKGINRYLVLYAGVLQEPDADMKSKEGKANFQSSKLSASFRPLKNGLWSYKVDSDSEGATDVIAKFFNQVVIPTPKEQK